MPQITVDTGINTKPILNGAKEMTSAIRSLQSWVTKSSKSMDAAMVGYARAMQNNATASKEFKVQIDQLGDSAQTLQNQLNRLAETKIDTKEYAQVKRDIAETEKSIQSLMTAQYKDVEEIQAAKQALAELRYEKERLEKEGKDVVSGATTQEYRDAKAKYDQAIEAYNNAIREGTERFKPIHVQQWEQMRTLTGSIAEGLSKLANTAATVGYALIHPFQALNRIIPIVLSSLGQLSRKVLDVAITLGKMAINSAAAFLRTLANRAREAAINIARLAGSAIVTGIRKIGALAAQAGKAILGIGRSAKRSNGGLKQAITMLIRYGLGIRSIFMLVRRLRSAIVDAFKNMAKQVPEVNHAISSLSASLGRLKNSMATAFQPILTAIAPYLTQLMDLISQAMTRVGMFIAALTGQNYVYKATKANYDYAKSLDKTKQSAKAAENQLASFDELNILKAPNDSSGGSATAADGGEFVKVPLENGIKEFVDTLKRMIKGGEFAEIGELLAGKINKFIGSIDWNGYAVKIGNLVNSLTEFYNAFMEGIDWEQVGSGIATAINGLVDTVDFEALGRALTQKFNALFGIFKGFVNDINALNLGEALRTALSSMINNIHTDEIGETLNQAIHKLLDFIMPALGDEQTWRLAGYKLSIMLNKLFGTSQSGETVWDRLAGGVVTAAKSVIASLTELVSNFEWGEAGNQFHFAVLKLIKEFPAKELGDFITITLRGIIDSILPTISDQTVWQSAGAKLSELINTLFKRKDVWEQAGKTANSMMAGILSFANGLVDTFKPEDAANSIMAALKQIRWGEIATQAWALMNSAFSKAGSFVDALLNKQVDYTTIQNRSDSFYGKQLEEVIGFNNQSVGAKLGARIREALSDIPWATIAKGVFDSAKEGFSTVGGNVSDFIVSVLGVTEDDVQSANGNKIKAVGKKFAELLSEAFKSAVSLSTYLIDSFDADQFRTGVESILMNMDWGGILRAFLIGLGKTARKLLESIPFIGDWFKEQFAMVDADEFVGVFRETIGSAFDQIAEFGSSKGVLIGDRFLDGFREVATKDGKVLPEVRKWLERIFSESQIIALEKGEMTTTEFFQGINKAGVNSRSVTQLIKTVEDYFINGSKDIADAGVNSFISTTEERAPQVQEATNALVDTEQLVGNIEGVGETVGDALYRQLDAAFTAIDAGVYGDATARDYFDHFIANFSENGQIKSEYETAVNELLGAGAVEAFNSGEMTAGSFYTAFQNYYREHNQEAKDTFSEFIGETTDVSTEASAAGTNNADAIFEAFKEEIMENGQVISAYKGSLEEVFGSVDGFEDGSMTAERFFEGWNEGVEGQQTPTAKLLQAAMNFVLGQMEDKTLEIGSPSKRAKRDGENLMKGFTQGVQDEESSTKSNTVGVFENIFGGIVASAVALAGLNLAVTLSMNAMQTTISTTLTAVNTNFTTFWSTVRANTTNALTAMSASITTSFGAMRTSVSTAMSAMQTSISTAFSSMRSAISSGASQMAGEAQRAFQGVGNAVSNVDWYNIGYEIVRGIKSGISNNWSWLQDYVARKAWKLYDAARDALGIASPSKLFRDGVGAMIGLGIAEGFEDTQPEILGAVTDVADAMADKMNQTEMMPGIGTEEALASFGDKIADSFASLLDRLQSIADSVAFRTPAVAAGTVVPYNVAAQAVGGSQGLVEALEVSNDDLANVVMQATNNAALAIVEAIQRYGGTSASDTAAQTNKIIDEINRRTRAQGVSPIII